MKRRQRKRFPRLLEQRSFFSSRRYCSSWSSRHPGVDGPANQIERFGTPLGYVDANKRFADSEEVERRWGDVAQELYGTGLFFMSCRQILLRSYNQFMDSVINPPTRIRTMQDWDNFSKKYEDSSTAPYVAP